MQKSPARVCVTGLGVVSSIGVGIEDFWSNLINGSSGISQIESFDVSHHDLQYAGEIKKKVFDPNRFDRRILKYGRSSQMAIVASNLALKDAGLYEKKTNCVSILIGTTLGESQVVEQIIRRKEEKNEFIKNQRAMIYPASVIAANVSKEFKFTADNMVFATACAAGIYSISYAYDLIKNRRVDFVLAGGVDSLSRLAFTGFSRLSAMSPDICRPFDLQRKGMILGEGSGMVLLENLESAIKRKSKIYAEILGYGLSCDANHMTDPSPEGIISSIKKSLMTSNITSQEIDYINAHGTGTIENDKAECLAYSNIFGQSLKDLPISSIKSMLGHTMGAASAIEFIACCLVLNQQIIPPTINFQHIDPSCQINCVPNKSIRANVRVILKNSQAFGGNNCSVVLSSPKV